MPRLKPDPLDPLRGQPPPPPPPRPAVDRYLAYRRANGAPTTARRLEGIVKRWACFLAQRDIAPESARPLDAMDFMAQWCDFGWSPATKRQAVSDLRTLHNWLLDREIATGRNPWSGVRGPAKPVRIPRVLSPEELRDLDAALARPTVLDLRDRSLIAFLRATGCRIREALDLDLPALALADRSATVLGKGNRERVVYLDEPAVQHLRLWLKAGRPGWCRSPAGPVWVGRHGGRLHYTVARDALIRAAGVAELGRHVHPHLLRHTFATDLLENGANLREIQELLGHADISSTQIYTHVATRRLRAVYAAAHSVPAAAAAEGSDPAAD